jgi:hypothetical protein
LARFGRVFPRIPLVVGAGIVSNQPICGAGLRDMGFLLTDAAEMFGGQWVRLRRVQLRWNIVSDSSKHALFILLIPLQRTAEELRFAGAFDWETIQQSQRANRAAKSIRWHL